MLGAALLEFVNKLFFSSACLRCSAALLYSARTDPICHCSAPAITL